MRGDIVKQNGLYYMKSHLMEESRTAESSSIVRATAKDVQIKDVDELADALGGHSWAQFALIGERLRALPSAHKEKVTKPPSAEAMEHLETAVEKTSTVCRDVRSTVVALSKLLNSGKVVRGSSTIKTQIEQCMLKIGDMEKTMLPDMQSMMVLSCNEATDAMVKQLLKKVAGPYEELERMQTSVVALLREQRRLMKD